MFQQTEHAHKRIVSLRLMEGDPVPEGYVYRKNKKQDRNKSKKWREKHGSSSIFCKWIRRN